MIELIVVTLASGLAGFIDAVVGGGGLVLVPALFSAFPNAAPGLLLGTNKSASVWGTGWSCIQYFKRIEMSVRSLWPAVVTAALGSWVGAGLVSRVDGSNLRRALPLILLGLLIYTLSRKELGREHQPRWAGTQQMLVAGAIGLVMGLYDGFFGPGTGSFLVFLFVRVLGYDFLHASAASKLINTATNATALMRFALAGQVWWEVGLVMAVANIGGSLLGTRLALKHGSGFVRALFIFVVSALILKTGYDSYLK